MLAPRKKLWSTPDKVIESVIDMVPLSSKDTVVDVGAGDGRVILKWAEGYSQASEKPSFIGIDIDQERIDDARANLDQLRKDETLKGVDINFVCTNALDCDDILGEGTVFFLYLIPRGLKKIMPLIRKENIRVITYMIPLPDTEIQTLELISVEHQPNTAWPLYIYKF